MTSPLWPYKRVDDDPLQEALERLSAVGQYLYDTMNGDEDSDRDRPDPLPAVAMECVRRAQVAVDEAIRLGSRRDRRKVGRSGLKLVEYLPGDDAA
jgi:hypothetical protein